MNKKGCYYEAPTFGASYPDGRCIDGYMWDLDAYEDGYLTSGGDEPCPWCNTDEYLEYFDKRFSGNARKRRVAKRVEIRRVKDWAKERSTLDPVTRKFGGAA